MIKQNAQQVNLDVVPDDPDLENLFFLGEGQADYIQQTPYEVWFIILEFIDLQPKTLTNLSRSCKMFKEICQFNNVWNMGYRCTFPILYQEMKESKRLKKEEFCIKSIDWKSETKKNYLYLAAFYSIIEGMSKDKEKGNDHFKKAEYEEALVFYKSALDLAK